MRTNPVKLDIEVREGPVDKFAGFGPPGLAEKLQARWELAPGAVFDAGDWARFLDKNHSLLPADFSQSKGVALLTDCPDATVAVHLHLTDDAEHEARDRTQHVDCSKPRQATKRTKEKPQGLGGARRRNRTVTSC